MNDEKPLVVVLFVIAMLMITTTTSTVYAQTTTMPEEESTTSPPLSPLITPSPSAQQIINNTKAECKAAGFPQLKCVELLYESPATVVVKGLVFMFDGSPEPESRTFYSNPFLWKAVDAFKAQGYRITDVEVTVLGDRSTNAEFNVIMSK
jgi:hypothetical protein